MDRHVAPLRRTHYPDSKPTRLLFLLNAVCLAEKQQKLLFFCLTQSGLEPMIYRTWGEQAIHYTTDSFKKEKILRYKLLEIKIDN